MLLEQAIEEMQTIMRQRGNIPVVNTDDEELSEVNWDDSDTDEGSQMVCILEFE